MIKIKKKSDHRESLRRKRRISKRARTRELLRKAAAK